MKQFCYLNTKFGEFFLFIKKNKRKQHKIPGTIWNIKCNILGNKLEKYSKHQLAPLNIGPLIIFSHILCTVCWATLVDILHLALSALLLVFYHILLSNPVKAVDRTFKLSYYIQYFSLTNDWNFPKVLELVVSGLI